MTAQRLLIENLSLIETLTARISWQGGFGQQDAEDFRSHVHLKLVDRDYEILRRFQNRSSLRTFLAVVIQRLFQDYRNHIWGKWRPSAEARRHGPIAVHLERLIGRDGFSFDDAVNHLHSTKQTTLSRESLSALSQEFPVRAPRRIDSEEALADVPDLTHSMECIVDAGRLQDRAAQTRAALDRAIHALSDEDQALVRLYFWEHMSIADIARAFGTQQKPLYRQVTRVLKDLRLSLNQAGVGDHAKDLLDHLWSDLLEPTTPQQPDGPSNSAGKRIGYMRPSNDGEVAGARE